MKKFLLMLLIMLFVSISAYGEDVTLQWDENVDASHYVVHWGEEVGNYTDYSPQITGLSHVITGLPDGKKMYFVVKAYNSCGNSSDFSDPISNCDIIREVRKTPGVKVIKIVSGETTVTIEMNN